MDAYASRRGVASTVLRFMLDGDRVQETDTPKMVCILFENFLLNIILLLSAWTWW